MTQVISYRQIYDRVFKRWSIPSRSDDNKTWQRIKQPERFCTPKDGIAFALWRMRAVLEKKGYTVSEITKDKSKRASIFTFKLYQTK